MEPRFRHDFSGVRVHTDVAAADSARALNADAYAYSGHIVFGAGQYRPHCPDGLTLLAHELTHVRQQPTAVDGAPPLYVGAADSVAEREADAAAQAVVGGFRAPEVAPADPAVRRSTAGAIGGGVLGAAIGGAGLGLLLGPLGAVVGGLVLGGVGAVVGNKLTQSADKETNDLQRITKLLSTSVLDLDFVVTDKEVWQVIRILEAMKPEALLDTVQKMRLSGAWKTLYKEMPAVAREEFRTVEERIDPYFGYLMPGDTIKLEGYAPGSAEAEVIEDTVAQEGFKYPTLTNPAPLVGLFPQQAADAIADEFMKEKKSPWSVLNLYVKARGLRYAPRHGAVPGGPPFKATRIAISPAAQDNEKRKRFWDYFRTIDQTSPLQIQASRIYLDKMTHGLNDWKSPEELWHWSREEAVKHPPQPSAREQFLQEALALKRMYENSRAKESQAPPKKAAGAGPSALSDDADYWLDVWSKFVAWMSSHTEEDYKKTTPEKIRGLCIDQALHGRVAAWERDFRKQQAEKREEEALNSPALQQNLDEMTRLINTYIVRDRGYERAEDKTHGVGYLIHPSDTEVQYRQLIAFEVFRDYLAAVSAAGMRPPPPAAFLDDWLRTHPSRYKTLMLVASYPDVEKYEVEIDIPAWQTAVEVGVSFIPIVGEIVGAYEVIAGEDLFGHPLGPVERGIMGVCILLPMVAKIYKVSKGLVTAGRIASEYRLVGREADAVYRAYTGIPFGSASYKLLEEAQAEIRAGKQIRDPERIKALQQVAKDAGLTDAKTAAALKGTSPSALAEAETRLEKGVARDLEKLGPMSTDSQALLRDNPELRGALVENNLAAEVFKKCKSPCWPKELTADQVRRVEDYLQGVNKTGDYDVEALRQYLYDNRSNLPRAINDITARKDAASLNAWLDFLVNKGQKITRVPSAEEVSAWVRRSHDIGAAKGLEKALKEGYAVPSRKFVNPFANQGAFGQGFDDILVKGDLDTGIISITEYKGGNSRLAAGQMSLDWVLENITRLEREGGADGRFWAGKLRNALDQGRLEGVVYYTPVKRGQAQATVADKLGIYKKVSP
jgi:hypothetical protein